VSDNDDAPIGQILSRREVLASLGLAGAAFLPRFPGPRRGSPVQLAPALPACVVRPAQEEGPYFVYEKLNRSDIRSDPATGVVSVGVPFLLTFRVSKLSKGLCAPIAGATVDIWHCDALGVYSDERDMNGLFDTRGKKFLRGFQTTDAAGQARFTTIYPGWYQGRAVHIHFKIRTTSAGGVGHDFTSQLYFSDTLSDRVHTAAPYADKGKGRLPNASDGIFSRQRGEQLLLTTTRRGGGYAALFDVALQMG